MAQQLKQPIRTIDLIKALFPCEPDYAKQVQRGSRPAVIKTADVDPVVHAAVEITGTEWSMLLTEERPYLTIQAGGPCLRKTPGHGNIFSSAAEEQDLGGQDLLYTGVIDPEGEQAAKMERVVQVLYGGGAAELDLDGQWVFYTDNYP